MISEQNAQDIVESLVALKNFPTESGARFAIRDIFETRCFSCEVAARVRDRLFERYDEWCGPASLIATIKEENQVSNSLLSGNATVQIGAGR